ncbi:MAG: fluoroquinolone resistance protein [Moritella sp.]|jgi:fluoroquinolone resistance protein
MHITDKTFCAEDFSQQDLQAAVFKGCHFYCCNFRSADLTDAEFVDCQFIERGNVTGCDFGYAELKDCSFKNCDLSMTQFNGAQCFGIEFRSCNLKGADFARASFANYVTQKSYFCSAYITQCNLSYANLEDQRIEKCDLYENRWLGANLLGASLQGSDLSRGEFAEDIWGQFALEDCNLSHVDLTGLDPRRVNLKGVTICEWQQEQLLAPFGLIIGVG